MTTCHHHAHGAPITQLRAEHDVILRALAVLERLAERLEQGQAVEPAALSGLGEFFTTFVDRCHHTKEERYLFPMLEQHGVPREGGPLGVMLHEHEQGRAYVQAITSPGEGNGRLAGTIRGYAAMLRSHIEKENQVLFRMAEQVLPEEAQRELAQCFETMEHADIGEGTHERLMADLERLEGEVLMGEGGEPTPPL